jgi:GNAT superfamily N-acetyltransferase
VKIEKARRTDAPAIVDLWIELTDYHVALDSVFAPSVDAPSTFMLFLLELIESEEAIVLVAREEGSGELAGYAMARVMHDPPIFALMPRGEILDFYVRPLLRRRGAGSAMLGRITSWFAGLGVTRLEVRVYRGNPIGYPFWEKQGFGPYLDTLSLDIDGRGGDG